MLYLWLKSLHLLFAIAWMSGLFYLPRLLVHARGEQNTPTREKLLDMAARLYRFSNWLMLLALLLGVCMLLVNSAVLAQPWMHGKLFLLFLMIGYQHVSKALLRKMSLGQMRSDTFYRVYNEIPVVLLLGIILLAVFRP
jgi:putative membrane protein